MDESESGSDAENESDEDDDSASTESFASEDEENGSPNESKLDTTDASGLQIDEPPSPPGEKCPICLNSLSLGQDIGTPNSCQGIHHFCLDCIEEWSANVNTCPVDRKEFTLVLVKRELTGPVIEKISVTNRSVVLTLDDASDANALAATDEDLTFCEICGRCDHEDRLLLCDGCDFGYHCDCLDPPILEIPIEEWFCPDCVTRLFGSPSDRQTTFDQELNRLRRSRRNGSGRVIARTRASEVVRSRIMARRTQTDHLDDVITHVATNLSVPVAVVSSSSRSVSNTRTTRRVRRRRTTKRRSSSRRRSKGKGKGSRRRTRTKSSCRKGKSRKALASTRALPAPPSARERISSKLGLERKKCYGPHALPLMNKVSTSKSISTQREYAGITSLSLMGQGLASYGAIPIFNDVDDEENNRSYNSSAVVSSVGGGGGTSVLSSSHARVNISSSILSMKSANSAATVETGDLLGSILAGQEILHAESSRVIIARDGTLKLNSKSKDSSSKKRGCTGETSGSGKSEGNDSSKTVDSSNNTNASGSNGSSSGYSSSEGRDSSINSSLSSSPRKVSSVPAGDDFAIVKPTPLSSCLPGSIPLKKRKIEHRHDDQPDVAQVKPVVQESPVEADVFSDIEPMTDDSLNVQSPNLEDKKPDVSGTQTDSKAETQLEVKTSETKNDSSCESSNKNETSHSKDSSDDTKLPVNIKSEPECNSSCKSEETCTPGESENCTKPPKIEKECNPTEESKVSAPSEESVKEQKDERKLKKCKHGKVIHSKKDKEKDKDKSSSKSGHHTSGGNKDEPLAESSSGESRKEKSDPESRSKATREGHSENKKESDPNAPTLRGNNIYEMTSSSSSSTSNDQWKSRSGESSKKRSYRESKDEKDKHIHGHRDGNFPASSRSNYPSTSTSSSSYSRSHHNESDRKHSNDLGSESKDHRSKNSYKDKSSNSHNPPTESSTHSRDRHSRRSSRDDEYRHAQRDTKFDESEKNKRKHVSSSSGHSESKDRSRRKESDRNYPHSHHRTRDRFDEALRGSDSDSKKRHETSSKRHHAKGNLRSPDGSEDDRNSQPTPTQDEGSSPNYNSLSHSSNHSSRSNLSKITKESLDGIRDWITSSGKSSGNRSNDHSSSKSSKNDSTHEAGLSVAASLFDQIKASVSHQKPSDGSNNLQQLLQAVSMSGLLNNSNGNNNGNSSGSSSSSNLKQSQIDTSSHKASSSSTKPKTGRTPEYSDNSDSDSDDDGLAPYSPSEDFDDYANRPTTGRGKGEGINFNSSSLSSNPNFQAAVDQILTSAQQQQQQASASSSNVFKKPRPPDSHVKSRLKQMAAGDAESLTSARELEMKEKVNITLEVDSFVSLLFSLSVHSQVESPRTSRRGG